MSPTKHHYTKYDIGSLCERMEARGQSRMLRSQPELCRDLLSGAALLRWMLDQAMPVAAIEDFASTNRSETCWRAKKISVLSLKTAVT